MNTTELTIVTFTLGRKTKFQRLKQQCGVYCIALYLKRRGYTLRQCLDLLKGGI